MGEYLDQLLWLLALSYHYEVCDPTAPDTQPPTILRTDHSCGWEGRLQIAGYCPLHGCRTHCDQNMIKLRKRQGDAKMVTHWSGTSSKALSHGVTVEDMRCTFIPCSHVWLHAQYVFSKTSNTLYIHNYGYRLELSAILVKVSVQVLWVDARFKIWPRL